MSADLIRQKARERHFLEQLLDGKKLENYKIPVPIKAELRKYQQVRLLFFLNEAPLSLFVFCKSEQLLQIVVSLFSTFLLTDMHSSV